MEYLYEAIEHHSHIPIKIFTHTIDSFPYHWHDDTEILFVLNGSVEISVEKKMTKLNAGNVFIVNNNELHYINATSKEGRAKLLALQFNMDHFSKYDIDSSGFVFQLKYEQKGGPKRRAYNQVRGILASMMKVVINNEEPMQLLVERHLLDLIIVLMNNFQILVDKNASKQSSEERIMDILKYISVNCKDHQLSLNQIAGHFHLSLQYLSRYFKNQMGVSLKKFIDNMRMNKSLQALKLTDDRIIDIALKYGFPDAKAYYRVFKGTMGITPAEYREEHKIESKQHATSDYFSINHKETLSKLFEYLGNYQQDFFDVRSETGKKTIDLKAECRAFKNTTNTLMTFGYAPHGLRNDFIKQIQMVQKDIGFKYVRFHGIFADEMLLYNEDHHGEVYYNFNHIDALLDDILTHRLKPFLELGFMPKDLASMDRTIFWWKSNVTPPKSINKWTDMLQAFIRHILNRYGKEEVLTWYFEFWNEPELGGFWSGNLQQFYDFFKASYKLIKSIEPKLKVGGFGNVNFHISQKWIKDYTMLASKDELKLDFFTFHIYQTSFKDLEAEYIIKDIDMSQILGTSVDMLRTIESDVMLGGPEFVTESIDKVLEQVNDLEISKSEYHITEWNSNAYCRDLVHDTCFLASYIVKNALANCEKVDSMGFWTYTDLFEEFRLEQPLYHGGFGLVTYNGIKKAAYHAYAFLNALGDEVVYQDDTMMLTKKGDDYQILSINYCHYNDLYSHFDYSQLTPTDRYNVFANQKSVNIKLELLGLRGQYRCERQRVNRDQGSSYDAWVTMGAPDQLTTTAYDYLVAASEPSYETTSIKVESTYNLELTMQPHEIQLIRLTKLY